MNKDINIVGLSGAKIITKSICDHLKVKPLDVTISRFADGEILVRPEEGVRNKVVTVVQSLSKPVNESLMELLIAIDALKRSSARTINVILPYYAYARQDRKTHGREPITAKLVAALIEKAGASRVTIIDVHSEQTQGFFEIPVDTLPSTFLTVREAVKKIKSKDLVVVSPDYGGVKRARSIANVLNCGLAILDKRRPRPNQAEIINILGNVEGMDCLISDDMIDTGGTLIAACKVLKSKGAKSISVAITHGIMSDPATQRINDAMDAKIISHFYLTNSIQSVYDLKIPNLTIVDLGKYLSEIIQIYHADTGSVSKIYDQYAPKYSE
jgi:ribose-phosphate pyrophosphokinase